MKVLPALALLTTTLGLAPLTQAQTLYVPGGAVGNSGNTNVGVGTTAPAAKLHVGGSNQEIRFDYNGTNNYYGSLRWTGLQLGNNSANRIVAGRSAVGGLLDFYVNNTNDAADYNVTPNGILAMRLAANGNVGIGTNTPGAKLDVVGDIRSTGVLIEKKLVFTPTAQGWYRVVSGTVQAGGTIRVEGAYDGGTTSMEFGFTVRGWSQGGILSLFKNSGVNGNIIDQARISTDGAGSVYLDLHISTAIAPAPLTVYGYGPGMPAFVANPVVGAVAGSTNVQVLPLGYSVGGYNDFRTTGNVVTYASDGLSPQGYIYHGASGQAAFGNGVINGETWITRTGGAGSIKLGDYDLNTAYLTVTGGSGNVGIGTTNPTQKLSVNGTIRAKEVIVETTGWSDYVLEKGYDLQPLSSVEEQIERDGHLPGIPSARDVAENGISVGAMQAMLLAKIEELTLHQIALEKRINAQDQEIRRLRLTEATPTEKVHLQ